MCILSWTIIRSRKITPFARGDLNKVAHSGAPNTKFIIELFAQGVNAMPGSRRYAFAENCCTVLNAIHRAIHDPRAKIVGR